MTKSEQRSLKKKAKILNKAIDLFLANGIKKVTMDDIAQKSNVSKVTIYKYFGDKESLHEHIAEYILNKFYKKIVKHHKEEETLTSKMINCTSVLIDFIQSENLSLCIKLSELNEEAKKKQETFNIKVQKIIIELIQEGKQVNLVRTDISDETIYHYIDMGLNYFQHNLAYRQKITTDLTFSREFMDFIWSNIFINHKDFKVSD